MKRLTKLMGFTPIGDQSARYGNQSRRKVPTAGGVINGQPYSSDIRKERGEKTIWTEFTII